MQSRTSFQPSPAQTIGQVSGSIGAVLAVEPMFYPQPQSGITDQQLFQRYATSSFMPNPEYLQRHYSDPDLQNPGQVGSITSLSPGTLYQTTNIPSNLMGVM